MFNSILIQFTATSGETYPYTKDENLCVVCECLLAQRRESRPINISYHYVCNTCASAQICFSSENGALFPQSAIPKRATQRARSSLHLTTFVCQTHTHTHVRQHIFARRRKSFEFLGARDAEQVRAVRPNLNRNFKLEIHICDVFVCLCVCECVTHSPSCVLELPPSEQFRRIRLTHTLAYNWVEYYQLWRFV